MAATKVTIVVSFMIAEESGYLNEYWVLQDSVYGVVILERSR